MILMKRTLFVILSAFCLVGCVKEPQAVVFPHNGPQGEPYSTSLFVATDRHEAGNGNNLSAMLQLMAANQNVVMPQMVLLGGDYVGRGPDHGTTGQPVFSAEDIFMFARGRVPFDMICHDYPTVKNVPKPLMKIARPLVNKLLEPPAPRRLYNVSAAKLIKEKVRIPVIAVGGIHDLAEIESVIGGHGLDAVSLCRPLILEPTLVQKYKTGKQVEAKCIECNYCLIGISQRPLRCYYGKVPKEIKGK